MTKVVNKYKEKYDVYIGRGSPWGNPYVIGKHGTREEVIAKYRDLVQELVNQGKLTKVNFEELKGKRLGCFCKPQHPCHGDVLVEFIEKLT